MEQPSSHAKKLLSRLGFVLNDHVKGSKITTIQRHNKQYNVKEPLPSFRLNGHTYGFHHQTQKLETPCTA